MKRGLQAHHKQSQALGKLWDKIAMLHRISQQTTQALDELREQAKELSTNRDGGMIFDGLQEAQFYLGFDKEIMQAGRKHLALLGKH